MPRGDSRALTCAVMRVRVPLTAWNANRGVELHCNSIHGSALLLDGIIERVVYFLTVYCHTIVSKEGYTNAESTNEDRETSLEYLADCCCDPSDSHCCSIAAAQQPQLKRLGFKIGLRKRKTAKRP